MVKHLEGQEGHYPCGLGSIWWLLPLSKEAIPGRSGELCEVGSATPLGRILSPSLVPLVGVPGNSIAEKVLMQQAQGETGGEDAGS